MGSLEPGSLCSPPSPAEQDEFPLANESIPEASNRNGFAGGGTARVRRLMIATRIWRPNFPLLFFSKTKAAACADEIDLRSRHHPGAGSGSRPIDNNRSPCQTEPDSAPSIVATIASERDKEINRLSQWL